jgi:hypothetical protein
VSKGKLPDVEVEPVFFTPKYGWPFVARNRRANPTAWPSKRTNLIVGACVLAAVALGIFLVVELVSHL